MVVVFPFCIVTVKSRSLVWFQQRSGVKMGSLQLGVFYKKKWDWLGNSKTLCKSMAVLTSAHAGGDFAHQILVLLILHFLVCHPPAAAKGVLGCTLPLGTNCIS